MSGKARVLQESDWSEIPNPKDNPEWAHEQLPLPESKEAISLRLDKDIIRYFKRTGKGYQTRMNAVLRAYMEAHQGS